MINCLSIAPAGLALNVVTLGHWSSWALPLLLGVIGLGAGTIIAWRRPKSGPTWRRRAAVAAVLFAWGAVLTIAIAWLGGAGFPRRQPAAGMLWGHAISRDGRTHWTASRFEYPGATLLYSERSFTAPSMTTDDRPRDVLPVWAAPAVNHDREEHAVVVYAGGWPMRASYYRLEVDVRTRDVTRIRHALLIESPSGIALPPDITAVPLPLRPIWSGLFVDTAMLAIVLGLLLAAARRAPTLIRGRLPRLSSADVTEPAPLMAVSVLCMRCGYDLSGARSSWLETCPLKGRCSECGLSFHWSELLSAKIVRPRWCVEYARTVTTLVVRSVRTWCMSFAPRSFWSDLRMSHEPNWGRLGTHVVLPLLALYLVFASAQAALVVDCVRSTAGWGSRPAPAPWDWRDVANAMLLPLSRARGGCSANRFFHGLWREPATVLGTLATVQLLCVMGFICLPVSVRRAKVRAVHLVRVYLYGVGTLTMLGFAFILGIAWNAYAPRFLVPPIDRAVLGIGVVGIFLVFTVVWWSAATDRYLRIPHAWGVGVGIVAMAGLATMLGAVLLYLARTGW